MAFVWRIIINDMSALILTHNLTKYYPGEKTPALDNLNLQVQAGEVYGYLGANGAGKSTTIRLLLNFLHPSSGTASILDMDSVRKSVQLKKHIGYLAGDVALYQKATGRELLDYLAHLQGGAIRDYRTKLEARFEAVLHKPIGNLSKGNRQKIGIIQAFMHQPKVLILDEPTSGLDPLMQEAFYETVREAKTAGSAVLMSSHNLAEAGALCDRVGIIKHGKLIHEQTVDTGAMLSVPIFRVTFKDHAALQGIRGDKAISFMSQADTNTVVLRPSGTIADALAALSRYDIRALTSESLDLEDEFLSYYGDQS